MVSSNQNKTMHKNGFSLKEAKAVAAALKIDFNEVSFTPEALCAGMNEELEHAGVTGKKARITARIALDHLKEDPQYYTKLAKMEKAIGLPTDMDAEHQYIYYTGFHAVRSYWWIDSTGNYWRYTNAPVGHPDHDVRLGEPLVHPEQPMPHTNPEFFTDDGHKRSQAVGAETPPMRNPAYDPNDPKSLWFEVIHVADLTRYIYLDADLRENLDLWVQYQLRLADAGLLDYRKHAAKLFSSEFPKDKTLGVMLMLVDQALFMPEDLVGMTVSELEFTDQTVRLRKHKLACDAVLYDFFTELVKDRQPDDILFSAESFKGRRPFGYNHIYSVFDMLKVDPNYLIAWHANHIFSRIVHRMSSNGVPKELVEEQACSELAYAMGTSDDVKHLLDIKLVSTLMLHYENDEVETAPDEAPPTPAPSAAPGAVTKSLTPALQDAYAVKIVTTELSERRQDEIEFSVWLHAEPMHDISPEEEQQLDEAVASVVQEDSSQGGEEGDESKEEPDKKASGVDAQAGMDPEPAGGGA